jgi:hypothetical protein
MVEKISKKYGIAFCDLHPVFKEDFRKSKKRFSYACDGHWNRYGHHMAAGEIAARIKSHEHQKSQP